MGRSVPIVEPPRMAIGQTKTDPVGSCAGKVYTNAGHVEGSSKGCKK